MLLCDSVSRVSKFTFPINTLFKQHRERLFKRMWSKGADAVDVKGQNCGDSSGPPPAACQTSPPTWDLSLRAQLTEMPRERYRARLRACKHRFKREEEFWSGPLKTFIHQKGRGAVLTSLSVRWCWRQQIMMNTHIKHDLCTFWFLTQQCYFKKQKWNSLPEKFSVF